MHALFISDEPLAARPGPLQLAAGRDPLRWHALLAVFNEVTVLGRASGEPPCPAPPEPERWLPALALPNLSSLRGQGRRRAVRRAVCAELERADAVVARLPSELGLVAIAEARRAGRPWAVELAGDPARSLRHHGSLAGRLYAPVMAARTRRAVAAAPFALYVTNSYLQARYPNRSGRTCACSDVALPPPEREALAHRLRRVRNRREAPLHLGVIASLRAWRHKGLDTTLDALTRARDRLPPVRLHLLGDGDPAPWQAALARRGLTGLVRLASPRPPGAEVRAWLDGIDLYLQPSRSEGLPRALLEAMSRGCPALASRCGGIPELLEPAALVPPGDAPALAEALVAAAHNRRWQTEQARRNWCTAAGYSAAELAPVRERFWAGLAEAAAEEGKGR